jgi:hypothetical protein
MVSAVLMILGVPEKEASRMVSDRFGLPDGRVPGGDELHFVVVVCPDCVEKANQKVGRELFPQPVLLVPGAELPCWDQPDDLKSLPMGPEYQALAYERSHQLRQARIDRHRQGREERQAEVEKAQKAVPRPPKPPVNKDVAEALAKVLQAQGDGRINALRRLQKVALQAGDANTASRLGTSFASGGDDCLVDTVLMPHSHHGPNRRPDDPEESLPVPRPRPRPKPRPVPVARGGSVGMTDNLRRHKFELLDALDHDSRENVVRPAGPDEEGDEWSLVFRHADGSLLTGSELRLLAYVTADDITAYQAYRRHRHGQ